MLMKKREKEPRDGNVMFYEQSDDESYERYKKIEYAKLAAKAIVSLILGIFISFLLKQ